MKLQKNLMKKIILKYIKLVDEKKLKLVLSVRLCWLTFILRIFKKI